MKTYCADCGERYQDENLFPCKTCEKLICYRCDQEHPGRCGLKPAQYEFSAGGGRQSNSQSLRLLFGLMERTIFICDHNIRNGLGDSLWEGLWSRYYQEFIGEQMMVRALALIDGSAAELQGFLLDGAHMINSISHPSLPPRDTSLIGQWLAQEQSEAANGGGLLKYFRHREEYRLSLEKDIQNAFNHPEAAQEIIDSSWSPESLAALAYQDRNGQAADCDAWRKMHPARFLELLDQAQPDARADAAQNANEQANRSLLNQWSFKLGRIFGRILRRI